VVGGGDDAGGVGDGVEGGPQVGQAFLEELLVGAVEADMAAVVPAGDDLEVLVEEVGAVMEEVLAAGEALGRPWGDLGAVEAGGDAEVGGAKE
jgi:hypothetical protein